MPAIKGKDGPAPSKTIQFTNFEKGLRRDSARDGIEDEALWECLNAQVIGPGDIRTLTEPGPSIATITPTVVSLWGVMIELEKVECERLIAICADGSAVAIDPLTGATTPICPAGGLDPTARLTMWRDTHVLFAGITTGFSSWDGTHFLTYPSTFTGTTTSASGTVTWVSGPIPLGALSGGMSISGPGIPAGTIILDVSGEELSGPTFSADSVTGFPTLLWTAGPALPAELVGVTVTGTGIPAGATILSVTGATLPANAAFTGDTVTAYPEVRWTGGPTAVALLVPGLRVVGAGLPDGTTVLAAHGATLAATATFLGDTTDTAPTVTYTGGATPLASLVPGLCVTGAGIPAGTTVVSILGTTLTLSQAATATATGVLLTTGPTLTLSAPATATATGVAMTTGPTLLLSANATATGATGGLTAGGTLIIGPGNATATGTVTITVGAGAPVGTVLDPESSGPRDVAVFEGRAWLVSGNRGLIFTGPGSFTTFGLVYAGGATTMPDSIFPGQITTIRAAIQLLWIFGPGAINTISNVQVTTGGITLFQNENLVAGTGSALAESVQPLFRTMAYLSPPGVYAILGATPQKLSDTLDGLMPDVVPVGPAPAAVFNLNALLCYAVLVEFEGQRRLLVYSRPRWLIADQGPDLIWITTLVRTDGQIQCWGTNGTTIRQLFAGDAADWDVRLKYFDFDMFTRRDTLRRIAVQARVLDPDVLTVTPDLQVEVENETTTGSVVGGILSNTVTWVNDALVETPWINASAAPVTWSATGNLIFLSEVKFSGNFLSAHLFGRASAPLIIGGVSMEVGIGGEWTFAP